MQIVSTISYSFSTSWLILSDKKILNCHRHISWMQLEEPFGFALLSDCSIRLSYIHIWDYLDIYQACFLYAFLCVISTCCHAVRDFLNIFFALKQHCLPETAICESIKSATADGPIKEKSQEARGKKAVAGVG